MELQLGKFKVFPHGEGNHDQGFGGYALVRWEDGGSTCEKKILFPGIFRLIGEAEEHATQAVRELFERDGTL